MSIQIRRHTSLQVRAMITSRGCPSRSAEMRAIGCHFGCHPQIIYGGISLEVPHPRRSRISVGFNGR
jgi:hypothetical protein